MRSKRVSKGAKSAASPADFDRLIESSVHGLTPKQTIALTALLEGKTQQEAATLARVHRNRIRLWLIGDDHFRAAYANGLKQLGEERMLAIGASTRLAHLTIVALLNDADVKPSTKLKAAAYLIDTALECDRLIAQRGFDVCAAASTLELVLGAERSLIGDRIAFSDEILAAFDNSPEGQELKRLNGKDHHGPLTLQDCRDAERRAHLCARREDLKEMIPPNVQSKYRNAVNEAVSLQAADAKPQSARSRAREIEAAERAEDDRRYREEVARVRAVVGNNKSKAPNNVAAPTNPSGGPTE